MLVLEHLLFPSRERSRKESQMPSAPDDETEE